MERTISSLLVVRVVQQPENLPVVFFFTEGLQAEAGQPSFVNALIALDFLQRREADLQGSFQLYDACGLLKVIWLSTAGRGY